MANYWDEQWKPVSFQGLPLADGYQVSNYGRIRRWKEDTNDYMIYKISYVRGYAYFSFIINTKKKKITKSVQRLVAEYFLEKPSVNHDIIIHLDYNKKNNYYKNL